jgi:hypothetical protein
MCVSTEYICILFPENLKSWKVGISLTSRATFWYSSLHLYKLWKVYIIIVFINLLKICWILSVFLSICPRTCMFLMSEKFKECNILETVCFYPQVKRVGDAYYVGSIGASQSLRLAHSDDPTECLPTPHLRTAHCSVSSAICNLPLACCSLQ